MQALVRDIAAPLQIEYRVASRFADGDAATAMVSLAAMSDRGDSVAARGDSDANGVVTMLVEYPSPGAWIVTITASVDGTETRVEFGESLPGSELVDRAGVPTVKVDTLHPERQGRLLEPVDDPPIPSPDQTAAPSPDGAEPRDEAATEAAEPLDDEQATDQQHQHGGGGVSSGQASVVRTVSFGAIRTGVLLRLIHLVAIACWLGPIALRLAGRHDVPPGPLSVLGLATTIGSGAALAAWSAPVSYPGLFRTAAMLDLPLGAVYMWAFSLKMVLVSIGVLATLLAVMAHDVIKPLRASIWSAALVVAVTVMTQAHLFAHA